MRCWLSTYFSARFHSSRRRKNSRDSEINGFRIVIRYIHDVSRIILLHFHPRHPLHQFASENPQTTDKNRLAYTRWNRSFSKSTGRTTTVVITNWIFLFGGGTVFSLADAAPYSPPPVAKAVHSNLNLPNGPLGGGKIQERQYECQNDSRPVC